jgi:hypothetical protein
VSSLWLYAVTTAHELPAGAAGLLGEPLQLLSCGRLAAVAGELEALPTIGAVTLRAHDQVVRRLSEGMAELLPARFGQAAATGDELCRLLLERQPELERALERVSGCAQMTLRLFGEPAAPPPADDRPPAGAAGPGTHYLLERRRRDDQRRQLPEAEELLAALLPLVRAQRLERQVNRALVGTAYHLVPRPRVPEYLRRVAEHRVRLLPRRLAVAGPAPPYAFAGEEDHGG